MTKRDGVGVNGIDVARESVFSFGEAARYVGKLKGARPVALQTLWRWATRGCSGVVLETIFVGGVRCTSKEALQRFFDAVTWARASVPTSGVAPSVVSGGVAEVGDVEALKNELRTYYKKRDKVVTRIALRKQAATLSERWLVGIAGMPLTQKHLDSEVLADMSVDFQRLMTLSETSAPRGRYDETIGNILKEFGTRVVVPLKQAGAGSGGSEAVTSKSGVADTLLKPAIRMRPKSVFVGQSFAPADGLVNGRVQRMLEACGITVVTGEEPKADSVSAKVKERIEACDWFLGLFTCRDKLEGKSEWATSAWVIDEKAYAYAKNKTLVMLKEKGVKSIGGLQGDYEYIEFDRGDMSDALVDLVKVVIGLAGGAN